MAVHGNAPSATPGKNARPLSPDLPLWEQQPDEQDHMYAAFVRFREMEKRVVAPTTRDGEPVPGDERSRLKRWSADWSWGYRARQWDLHVSREATEAMVRYRLDMNERQRQAGRIAQSKIINWLVNLDPSTLKPLEAARWFEVAVRVEREAAGAHLSAEGLLPEQEEEQAPIDERGQVTLKELLGNDGTLDDVELAEAMYLLLKQSGAAPTDEG